LAATVVGDDDSVDAALAGLAGVVGMEDALEEDRHRRPGPQPVEVVPGQARLPEDAYELADRGAGVLLGRPLEALAEDRVGEEVGEADSLDRRQIGVLEVPRLPAGERVVDGDHD